jgi:hypothetical protein
MLDRLDEVLDERVKALGEIERDKLRVASDEDINTSAKIIPSVDILGPITRS